jgi:hypothetical protein
LVEILGLQTKEYRRIFHTKKAMVAILILGKIDLKSKTVTKKKDFYHHEGVSSMRGYSNCKPTCTQ